MASKTTYQLELLLGARTSASYNRSIRSASKSLSSISNTAKLAAAGITTAFAAINITEKIEDAIETYQGFEQALANTSAIAKATATEQEKLSKAARDAGRDTIYTAENSAAALGYMALAGWDVNKSTQALMPTLKLASATNADLKITSDLLTDSMSATGQSVDKLDEYLDLLIAGNNNANTTAEQLMEALTKSGGAARTLGADLDDTITALGILANNSIKGTEAGTALNSMMVRLAGNTTAIKELNNLKINIWDDKGNFIGLKESLVEINNALSGLSDQEKASALKNIAGTHYYSQMSYLLDAVQEGINGEANAWDNLEDKLNSSGGALDEMYSKTTDTLEFATKRWESAKDAAKIDFADTFSDNYKDTLNWMSEKLPEVTDAVTDFAKAHEKDIAKAFDKAEEIMSKTWDVIENAGTFVIKNKGPIISGIKGIGAALATSFAIGKIGAGITMVMGLLSNPVLLAGAGIAAAVGGFVAISNAIEETKKAAVQASLEEHLGSISLSLEKLDKVARQVVGEDSLRGVSKFMDALSEAEKTMEGIEESWDTLQKSNWVLNAGFEFDKEDSEEYKASIDSYISSVEQYVKDKGYEVHLAVSLLFSDDATKLNDVDAFYTSIENQLTEYSKKLSEHMTEAMSDGIINLDEDKIAQEYISKMNKITQAITNAESKAKLDSVKVKYNAADLDKDSFEALEKDISEYINELAEGNQNAYESAMSMYYAKLELDDTYTQADFKKDSEEAFNKYITQKSETILSSSQYMLDAINEAYPELQKGLDSYSEELNRIINQYATEQANVEDNPTWSVNADGIMTDIFERMSFDVKVARNNAIDDADRGALKELLEQMLPTVQELEPIVKEYKDAGKEIPADLQEFMTNWQKIYDLVGGQENQEKIDLTEAIDTSEMFKSFLEKTGYEIDDSRLEIQRKLDDTYSQGFEVESKVKVNLKTEITGPGLNYVPPGTTDIKHNAKGGIYDHPILTTFAEEGPEAAIPIDGSQRAKSLLLETAERLGMISSNRTRRAAETLSTGTSINNSESGNVVVNYSPQIVIQGNASKEDIQSACSLSLNELKNMLEQINSDNRRVAFS